MTLMEILVALSLLMIVIVGTTPVMLQAYDGLYTAGEYTQDTYEAKSEIEDKLATRNTRDVYPDFTVNFQNLGEVATLNARRAVSSIKGSLETLFTNARVRVAVISAKKVNDDYACTATCRYDGTENSPPHDADCGFHEVILQTTNLDFGTTDAGVAQSKISINDQRNVVDGDESRNKIIDISFLIPDKQQNDAAVYSYNNANGLANVRNLSVDPITGRITVEINGFDFTQSPIKIFVSYLDENNIKQTTETYLEVDTPTIIAAGAVGTYDYYTSPGVVTKTITNKNETTGEITKTQVEEFNFWGRKMALDTFTHDTLEIGYNAPGDDDGGTAHPKIDSGVYAIPAGTVFKSVTWIDNDETSAIKPYYVFTGTNGTIYRTYSLSGSNTAVTNMLKGIKKDYYGADTSAKISLDKTLTLDGRTYYPAMWGGDVTHQFGYSTYFHSMGYQSDGDYCWYTATFSEADGKNGNSFENPEANSYSTRAKHAYYYNGYATAYNYTTQNSRKISYILTEVGFAVKRGGMMDEIEDFGEFYNKIWEDYSDSKYNNTGGGSIRYDEGSWYYRNADGSFEFESPIYFTSSNTNSYSQLENGFANLRIKYLTTNSPYSFASEKREESSKDDTNVLSSNMWLNDDVYTSKVTVTDAVYIPQTTVNGKTVGGEVFYVGTVNANALINQVDNMSPNANQHKTEHKRSGKGVSNVPGWVYSGFVTSYAVFGDGVNGTTVWKWSLTPSEHDHGAQGYIALFQQSSSPINFMQVGGDANVYNEAIYDYQVNTQAKVNSAAGNKFFVYRSPGSLYANVQDGTTSIKLTDVKFTMGFASDRNMAYSQIAFGRVNGTLQEAYKGCEPYYFKSHYGDTAGTHVPNLYMTPQNTSYMDKLGNASANESYFNAVDNDYYNVWFPGEMYNLTHVATKEGVTVSVGYAVAGSSYQFLNPNQHTNSSTGLGGIYNDGVLSAMVGGVDSSLTNLLYYKDNVSFDNDSLYDGTAGYQYQNYNGDAYGGNANAKATYNLFDTKKYGTHTRDSVQFTAIDIGLQYTKISDTSEKATYYAYYADNKGRVFRSKVATRTSTSTSAGTPVKVSYISDELYTSANVPSSDTIGYMEQLKLSDGTDFSAYFDKITTIKCEGKYILISGHSRDDGGKWNAVLGTVEDDGTVVFNRVSLDEADTQNYEVEDILILDGYAYFAGVDTNDNTGYIYVQSIQTIANTAHNGTIPFKSELFAGVPDPIYAIAGHN